MTEIQKPQPPNPLPQFDFEKIIKSLWSEKKKIIKVVSIFMIIGIFISISIPKTYTTRIILSPESNQTGNNSLAGMASMIGLSGIGATNQDALNSSMFPDIIKSTPFIVEMYNVKVTPKDSTQSISLAEYISNQKKPWWSYCIGIPSFVINYIMNIFSSQKTIEEKSIDIYRLTGKQKGIIELIKASLKASEDQKSNMIIISATLQDPEVTATVADSAVSKLQKYIIDYRTRKAQDDCRYLEKLCKEKKADYLLAQQKYADFMDANRNIILQKTQTEGTRLQNEMSITFQVYSQIETQLQMAKAKVQEAKPVFAIVEPASIPLAPSGPKKSFITFAFTLLGLTISSMWILFGKDLWNSLKIKNKE